VVALLRERHLPVTGASACGVVAATVAVAGAGPRVRVTIVDPDGRTAARVADDVEAAATFIESWARPDVSDPLLRLRAGPPGRPPATGRAVDRPRREPAMPHPIAVSVAGEFGVSSDGAQWAAVRADVCASLGAMCLGGLARYAVDLERRGDSVRFDTARSGLDLFLTADAPIRRGALAFSPGAGVGLTSIHASRDDPERDQDDVAAFALRAHLASSFRLAREWSVAIDLAAEYAPLADTVLGDEPGDMREGDPLLAGAPIWYGWVGVGVSYGGPDPSGHSPSGR
jgi:hypothetical protein